MRAARLLSALALVLGLGCAPRMLRLENRVLVLENERLERELAAARARALPEDYALNVDMAVLRDFAVRAGFTEIDDSEPGVLFVQMEGVNTRFRLMFQLFEKEQLLYIAATDYFRLEEARDSRSMVALITTMSAINYELLLGKLQLNPRTGAVTMSVELNLDDGLGFNTFKVVSRHLARTADQRYPDLVRAASGSGI